MAPRAADRLFTLLAIRFLDGTKIAESTDTTVVFAHHASLDVRNVWYMRRLIPDDHAAPNTRGTLTLLSGGGHRGRTTDLAINLRDDASRDAAHATPLGRLRALDVASRLKAGDTIRRARIVEERR